MKLELFDLIGNYEGDYLSDLQEDVELKFSFQNTGENTFFYTFNLYHMSNHGYEYLKCTGTACEIKNHQLILFPDITTMGSWEDIHKMKQENNYANYQLILNMDTTNWSD